MTSDFRLSSAWPVLPLADVVYFQEGPGLRNWQYRDVGIPFVNIRCIKDGRLLRDEMTCLDLAEVEQKYQHFLLDVGDYVVSSSGTLGRLAEVFPDDLPCMLNTSVIRFRPKQPDSIDRRYLRYFLTSAVFEQQILAFANGSAQLNYGPSHLKRMGIVVPPKSVQVAIGELLGALDDRITLLRETNQTLEAIAQALFKSWFVDFDPVRAKAEGKVPEGIDATTAALFPDAFEDSELELVPKGWQVESFENCITVLETGRRPKGGVGGIESGIPSIGAESVTKIGDFDYSKLKYVSADFFETMRSGKLESRDVLLYKDGGKPGVFLPRVSMFGEGFPFEVCGINEHVFRIRVKAPLSQTFLYFWLWSDSVMHELKHRGGKAAIPGINQKDVKELKIAVPYERVLTQFDTVTSPLISQILSNSKSIKVLIDLRDTLLPRLISGELRIADAEAELEKAIA